jgi:hypothetical protein
MTPMPAPKVLETFFLEARCKLLDVAAVLDRIDRGEGTPLTDPRMDKIRRAIETLLIPGPGRAERIQEIFSLEYDPEWKIPEPK